MDTVTKEPPAWLMEALAISEAQVEAGKTVSGETVLQTIFDAIAELDAEVVDSDPQRKSAQEV